MSLTYIIRSAVRKQPNKELFGILLNRSQVRLSKSFSSTAQSLLLCSRKYPERKSYLTLRNNVRYTQSSHKPSGDDKFIPKDPIQKINLWRKVVIILGVSGLITAFMLYVKNLKLKIIERENKRHIGKAAIGGKFELIDSNNKVRKSEDFLGQWLLIYFGFTHCPDVCPEEMEKMVKIVEIIEKNKNVPDLVPIFISVDPERDTPSVVGKYVKEFSEKFVALTGSIEQIRQVCKTYRVYFSAGPKDEDSDYIVDHSIIMYLVDPKGEFVEYYGQSKTAEEVAKGIQFYMHKHEITNKESFLSKFNFSKE